MNKYEHHPKQRVKQREDYTPEEVIELTKAFHEKNTYLAESFKQLTPREFYRGLFPEGSFETYNNKEQHKPNGIISVLKDKDSRGRKYNRILFDDFAALDEVMGKEFVIISPVAYSGRRRESKLAYKFYGIAIDLDEVDIDCIRDLIHQMQNDIIPYATYIVNSGTGLHIYYAFETPIPAMPKYFASFSRMKEQLSNIVWNQYTSNLKQKQAQGIFQGYRAPGTQTKISEECIVTAFEVGKKVTVHYLNEFVDEENQADFDDLHYTSLQEAEEMWQDWYERRVIRQEPVGNYKLDDTQKKRRRAWYDAWLEKMRFGSYDGNRHYCIGVLFNYAMKAEIPLEEALEDALELVYFLDSKTTRKGNRFTEDDVYAAQIYYDRKFIKMGRAGIQQMTNIDIGVTKRNGRKQDVHLKRARAVQNEDYPDGEWRNKEGRPSAEQQIREYLELHPEETNKSKIAAELGISRTTLIKWWKVIKENQELPVPEPKPAKEVKTIQVTAADGTVLEIEEKEFYRMLEDTRKRIDSDI